MPQLVALNRLASAGTMQALTRRFSQGQNVQVLPVISSQAH